MRWTPEVSLDKDTDTMTDDSIPSAGEPDALAHSTKTQSDGTPPHSETTEQPMLPNDDSHIKTEPDALNPESAQQQPQSQSQPSPPNQPSTSQQTPAHPRSDLPGWKWKLVLTAILINGAINGYDVSNVANIQPRLYDAFHDIKLLPWIGLSYSLSFFAVLSVSRKAILCFDLKWVMLASQAIFIIGAAVAGSAQSLPAVIVGRVIMGIGGSHCQTAGMAYFSVLATPVEMPKLFALMSACWAVGLVVGGPVGSAFSANQHATWRWAFYLNLPFTGLCLILSLISLPKRSFALPVSLVQRLGKVDLLGITLNIVVPVLFGIGLTFDGPVWSWSSGSSIAVWVVFAVTFIFWGVQQYFCILTTPAERALPLHILRRLDLLPIFIATGCAGATYAVTLYYTPLFFSFARGFGAIAQTVRIFPFIFVFIVSVMTTGTVLPIIGRYNLIYIVGGATTLIGGAAMAATMSNTVSDAQVMGLEAIIGLGLGMHFQHGVGIANVINKDPRDRLDSVVICNMTQMGAIGVILAVAGSIYQNVGFQLLKSAVGSDDFSASDVRDALAGLSSDIWHSRNPEVIQQGVAAVTTVIAREFYIVAASGAVCLACGLLMKWEKLDYGRKKPSQPEEKQANATESA